MSAEAPQPSAPQDSYRVTVEGSATVLLFGAGEAAAVAEFTRRRELGQRVFLEVGIDDGRGPVDFQVVRAFDDPDLVDDGPFWDGQPWPNEDADMERSRGIDP